MIHTSNAHCLRFPLLLTISPRQPEPDFEVCFLRQPLHRAHRPGEHLALVLGIAVSEHGSVVGAFTEQREGRQGVGRVRLSVEAV
jgi:hypothetical protein